MAYDYRSYPPVPEQAGPLVPSFAGLGVVESTTAGPFPLHRHRDYEVIVPERGAYRCRLNGIDLALGPGRCLVLKPGDQHEDLLSAGGRHLGVWFRLGLDGDGGGLPSLPLFADAVLPEQQVVALDLREAARDLLRESEHPDAVAARLQDALLGGLFWRLVRAADPAALAPGFVARCAVEAFPARLRAALARGPASPAELARTLGLGERALRSACRSQLGVPPARAIMDHRLDRAAELLRATGLGVAQVAERLGFANPYHFARAFRRRHGMPPSACRPG